MFKEKKILVVGDIMLDEFVETQQSGFSQEYANNPILQVKHRNYYLGGAANVALNCTKLEAEVFLLGTTGVDKFQEILHELLRSNNISTEYVVANPKQHTTLKTRVLQNGIPLLRIDEETTADFDKAIDDYLLFNFKEIITKQKPDVIIFQDYNKGVLNPYLIPLFLELARENKIPVCVDPKFENWNLYKEVALFKPNRRELAFMNQLETEPESDEDIVRCAEFVRNQLNCKTVLVTLGSRGTYCLSEQDSFFTEPYKYIAHPDVCGAGDTVIAVIALAYASGYEWKKIAALANKAANIVCHKRQIQPVNPKELQD